MLELTLDEAIKHCKENVQKETQNGNLQCAIEHNQLAIWLSQLEESKVKAAAYDRLMSGGKKTLKEWANIFGLPVAVDKNLSGIVFDEIPELLRTVEAWRGEHGYTGIIPATLIDFNGDWQDSLTLPEGWEEKQC